MPARRTPKSTAKLLLAGKGKRRDTGAPVGQPRLTARKTGHCTCKQGPLQKHSQLNQTTIRSCKKKQKMPTTPMRNTAYRALDKNLAIANKSRVSRAHHTSANNV